jgi:hypothetical protein
MRRDMGSALRPIAAAAAVVALIAGAAWWIHADTPRGAAVPPTAPAVPAPAPAPVPADATSDIGAVAAAPMPATRAVVVRVVDAEDEHPLAGASVHVRVGGDEAPSFDETSAADAEGRAHFALPAAEKSFEVFVTAANHVYARLEPERDDDPAAEVVVSLAAAGSVSGVVRGADGRPVDGVNVDAAIDGHDGWPGDGDLTKDGGAYRIDGVEVGAEFSVSVKETGRIASRTGLVVTKMGEVVTADLTLVAAATLRVRVLWPDGLPVAGASVQVQPSGDESDSDEQGRADFDALPAGKHHVVVSHAGFADAETDVEIAAGESKSVDLRPVPNAILSGVVVDDAGFPVAGAAIAVDGEVRTRTLADGKFRIASPDEDAHDLVVTHDGHCDAAAPGVTAPDEDMKIVVARRPKIRCRLVLPAGVAAPKHVAAWWDSDNAASTVEDGVLTIQVAPGSQRVSFQVPGCITVDRQADAAPGQVVDLGDVVLVAAPKLTGRVVDEQGRPVKAFVFAKVGGAPQVPLRSTDADGGFEIDGLPPGAAEVRAESKGFVNSTIRFAFTADAKPAVIVVKRGGGVKGKVVDEHGVPAPKAVYVGFADANDPENKDRQAFPNIAEDGTFEVRLLPGKYKALTTLDDGQGTAEVVVVDGQTVELTISINR